MNLDRKCLLLGKPQWMLFYTVRQKPSVGDWGFPLLMVTIAGLIRDRDIVIFDDEDGGARGTPSRAAGWFYI